MPDRRQSLRRRLGGLAAAVVVVALLMFWQRAALVATLHQVDQRWLDEAVIDTLSRWRGDEDWSRAEALARVPDYHWVQVVPGPVRIAHALGEAARPGANSLGALQRASARGLKLFEVDLWMEGDRIRCHHGPPGPPPFKPGDCEFAALLGAFPADAWLVLDIKTDFVATGERALQIAAGAGRTAALVFQLYKPDHLRQFNLWQIRYTNLPGPLVTAYQAHRAMRHVAAEVRRAGVGVLTLPIERLPAYRRREAGLTLLVHPVHTCAALDVALRAQVQGFYQLSALDCPR